MSSFRERHAMAFIMLTVLVDTIGFGIVIPVTPELIMELTGEGLSGAAQFGGGLLFAYALMQFVFAPVLGNLSDRFGRRPVLLVSLSALGLDYIFMGLAPSITWLFVGRLIAGAAGATHATANAYVADVTPPEKRAQRFGLVNASWGLGFVLGPVLGGLLGELGPRVPFFAAAGLALANVAYGALILPETLRPEARRPFTLARANPVGAVLQMRHYPLVLFSLGALVLYQIAHDANPSTWTYYTMLKFDWSERMVGLSMGMVGICMTIVQAGLIGAVIGRFGAKRTVYGGMAVMATGFLGFAFAPGTIWMFVFIVPFALGSVAMPALRGILSAHVPENAQGELQGAIASLVSLTAIIAPLLMTQLFAFFTGDAAPVYFPGASFLAAALLTFASAMLLSGVLRGAAPEAVSETSPPVAEEADAA